MKKLIKLKKIIKKIKIKFRKEKNKYLKFAQKTNYSTCYWCGNNQCKMKKKM